GLGPRRPEPERLAVHPPRLQGEDDVPRERPGDHPAGLFLHFADRPGQARLPLVEAALGEVPTLVGEVGVADEAGTAGVQDDAPADQPTGRGGGRVDDPDGIGDLVDEQGEGHRARGTGAWGRVYCVERGPERKGVRSRPGASWRIAGRAQSARDKIWPARRPRPGRPRGPIGRSAGEGWTMAGP